MSTLFEGWIPKALCPNFQIDIWTRRIKSEYVKLHIIQAGTNSELWTHHPKPIYTIHDEQVIAVTKEQLRDMHGGGNYRNPKEFYKGTICSGLLTYSTTEVRGDSRVTARQENGTKIRIQPNECMIEVQLQSRERDEWKTPIITLRSDNLGVFFGAEVPRECITMPVEILTDWLEDRMESEHSRQVVAFMRDFILSKDKKFYP